MVADGRSLALGETDHLSFVDRLGIWLSRHKIERLAGSFDGRRVGDFGSGFRALTSRPFFDRASHVTLIDVSIAPELKGQTKVTAIEGQLPGAMGRVATQSIDIALCVSVLEHLATPQLMLDELFRVTAKGGVCIVNVPNWLGKRLLEFSAFRLGLSPRFEMDDHKMYYAPRDLWPLLVKAGFAPSAITIRRHKLRSNTIAVARRP